MIEKYGCYEFEISKRIVGQCFDGWVYKIYIDDPDYIYWMGTNVYRESDEWYDTEQEARFAAIGHIDLLENGEG